VFGGGVAGTREDPCPDASRPAGDGEEDGFGEELDPDTARCGAQGSAQPDLEAAFEDGDDHDVSTPTTSTRRAWAESDVAPMAH
jgi:hypothetical protein